MANQQMNTTINAPGYQGIDQETSPFALPDDFAWQANNAVIDSYGRLGCRKGIVNQIVTDGDINATDINGIYDFTAADGTNRMFCWANGYIHQSNDEGVTWASIGGAGAWGNDWKAVELADDVYFFQDGEAPQKYTSSTNTLAAQTGTIKPQASAALAAFGRTWVGTASTMYFSDTLIGDQFDTGASGSLDMTTVWPTGKDNIIALAEFNDYLVIFGQHSIVIYEGAEDPSTMVIYDNITGVGCTARDSVASTGTDLYFLDHTGVRSLGRTIQAGSAPMSELTKGMRTQIMIDIDAETGHISACYSPEEKFYLINFPAQNVSYCLDTRKMITGEDGQQQSRITTWSAGITSCVHVVEKNKVWLGKNTKFCAYDTYNDDSASTYDFVYATNPVDLGGPAIEKFWKHVTALLIGGGTSGSIKWSNDYAKTWKSVTFSLPAVSGSEWNEAEYNEGAEFANSLAVNRVTADLSGAGYEVIIRITGTIDGNQLSIQQLTVAAIAGAQNG